MAAIEQPETDPVRRLLRRRPPAAALGWAAAPFGPGSQVVSVRPLASAWLANHALEVADAAGTVHRVVLRRWARPGWDEEDPDFTAAREAAVLDLLAPTPVPAPTVVAADPDGAVCDVPALLITLLPGDPPDLSDPGRLVEGLAAALPPIHAVAGPRDEAGARVVPATTASMSPRPWSRRPGRPGRGCGGGRSRSRPGRRPTSRHASSTATTTRPTPVVGRGLGRRLHPGATSALARRGGPGCGRPGPPRRLGLGPGPLILGGEGTGHVLEGLAGRLDPDEPLGEPGRDHQHGPEQVAVEDVELLLGLDQLAEQRRAGDAADAE